MRPSATFTFILTPETPAHNDVRSHGAGRSGRVVYESSCLGDSVPASRSRYSAEALS
jgi:hypothetical protein